MMRVLVTGGGGQLAQELRRRSASSPHEFIFLGKEVLDISVRPAVEKIIDDLRPDVLINSAAYTAVDRAEDERDAAMKTNTEAVGHMAEVCAEKKIFFVHFSTDYVFDGQKSSPYIESDLTNPKNAYGQSKLLGEEHILRVGAPAAIIRTSWLYSKFGNNFVKTILRLSRERPELRIVYDQIGSPTFAGDLAVLVAENINAIKGISGPEIFHFANEGAISWFDFALAIKKLSGAPAKLIAITSRDFPTKAARPSYSVFAKEKVKAYFKVNIPDWLSSLESVLKEV